MTSMWISDGSSEISIQDEVLQCSPPPGSHDNVYGGMWLDADCSKSGLNSGEHYWKIHFKNVESSAWVGVSNESRFKKGYATKGLFYGGSGGNLSDGSGLLVQHFGPPILNNDIVGIIVSFEESKLRLYFDHNGTHLGLGFEVDASILPDAWPVIRFSHGHGSATIEKQGRIPRNRFRDTKRYVGLEGSWQVVLNTIKLNGIQANDDESDHLNYVTMKISLKKGEEEEKTNSLFDVHLRIVNHIFFTIQKEGHGWKGNGISQSDGVASTRIGSINKNMELEREMTQLCHYPDSVVFNNINQVKISKGNSAATFKRYDESPKPVLKNPF